MSLLWCLVWCHYPSESEVNGSAMENQVVTDVLTCVSYVILKSFENGREHRRLKLKVLLVILLVNLKRNHLFGLLKLKPK